MKKVIAGIDLHSNNLVVGIMDQDGKRVGQQKLPCELTAVVKFLAPFKKRLEQVAVESTYNWYWLVDGLQALACETECDPHERKLRRTRKSNVLLAHPPCWRRPDKFAPRLDMAKK